MWRFKFAAISFAGKHSRDFYLLSLVPLRLNHAKVRNRTTLSQHHIVVNSNEKFESIGSVLNNKTLPLFANPDEIISGASEAAEDSSTSMHHRDHQSSISKISLRWILIWFDTLKTFGWHKHWSHKIVARLRAFENRVLDFSSRRLCQQTKSSNLWILITHKCLKILKRSCVERILGLGNSIDRSMEFDIVTRFRILKWEV